ncbi:MAG: HupE/UreJ family protein [Chthoniobacterales bacterium]|nr:HupE/UreJ family protein [Chthoniobacterales bacterium]
MFLACAAAGHDLPLCYVDLQINRNGVQATVEASARNFARELPNVTEENLLDGSTLARDSNKLLTLLTDHLLVTADGEPLRLQLLATEPLAARRDVRLRLQLVGKQPAAAVQVSCDLFSSDGRHRTFLNIYQSEKLRYQGIFDKDTTRIDFTFGSHQGAFAIVRQFVWEGIHHIFIGPDHILFIVGLLLLGGTLGQLLKIVTAFTIAHSVTLVLATLNILSPPPRVIEPAIALSIIFVGAHALILGREKRDWRLLFAFCFGFVHGFGFANVLREMELPRAALGWSLFSFNVGVEIGQACIVLAVAPLLAVLYRRSAPLAGRVVAASSFGVVFAGSFWFVQRLFP